MSDFTQYPPTPSDPGAPTSSTTTGGVVFFGLIAFGVWVWAAWSSVVQKQRADRLIRDAWDISAVQIQQLNGQVTAHAVMAIAVALAATVPLIIIGVGALASGGARHSG